MTMENKASDIDRVMDEDEQIVMETTRMRPYLDLWDVSIHIASLRLAGQNIRTRPHKKTRAKCKKKNK